MLLLTVLAVLSPCAVHDHEFRHDNIMTFYISWFDPGAYATMTNTTARVADTGGTCRRPCSSMIELRQCCDDIYLPSFIFRNANGFSQDRQVAHTIHVNDTTGVVTWEAQVHGT